MSSNKHARVVTSSALFDHHPVAFADPSLRLTHLQSEQASNHPQLRHWPQNLLPPEYLLHHCTRIRAVTTGAVTSATVTAVAVAVKSAESVAVNVTTVFPIGNTSGASFVTVTLLSTLSSTVAESKKAAASVAVAKVPLASVAAIVASETVITGGVDPLQ